MAKIKTLVLDASVIVKWFNREEDTEKALELKEQYENGSIDLAEPELLAYELGNSLRYNPQFRHARHPPSPISPREAPNPHTSSDRRAGKPDSRVRLPSLRAHPI